MKNWRQTLMTQYANSPTIVALIETFHQCLDFEGAIDAFFQNIWHINTANSHGLDIWGKIVGINRQIQVSTSMPYFGYEEQYTQATKEIGPQPFDQYPFGRADGNKRIFSMDDAFFRQAILTRAMSNITDSTIPNINRLLSFLFKERGRCWVIDNYDMSISYHFDFSLNPIELALIISTDIMARPAGVQLQLN